MYGFHKINKTLRSPSASSSSTSSTTSSSANNSEINKQKQKQAEEQVWEFSHVDFRRGGSALLDGIKRKATEAVVESTLTGEIRLEREGEGIQGRTMLGVNGAGIHRFAQQFGSPPLQGSLTLPLAQRNYPSSPQTSSYQPQQQSTYEDQYLDNSRRGSYASNYSATSTGNSNFYPSPTPSFYNSPVPVNVGNYSSPNLDSPEPFYQHQQFQQSNNSRNNSISYLLPSNSNQYHSPPPPISSTMNHYSPSSAQSFALASQQQSQELEPEQQQQQSSDKKRIKLSPSPSPLPPSSFAQSQPQLQQFTGDQDQDQILWDDLLRSHSHSQPSLTQSQPQEPRVQREEGMTYPFYEGIQLELVSTRSRSSGSRTSKNSISPNTISSNLPVQDEGVVEAEEEDGEGYKGGSEIRKW